MSLPMKHIISGKSTFCLIQHIANKLVTGTLTKKTINYFQASYISRPIHTQHNQLQETIVR